MENSIIGGEGGVRKGHFPHSIFIFFSKWPKNQFQTRIFFHVQGGSPLGAPQAPPPQASQTHTKVTKPCQGIVHCACCGQNFACCSHHCTCHSKIWHLRRQKFACPKVVLSFFQKFPKFFGIFNGENTLFTKSDKKWSSFRKKLLYFFP